MTQPIELRLHVVNPRTFALSDRMEFRVTLTNRTTRPLLVCRENWSMPTGLIYLRAFREDGHEVPAAVNAHLDYEVSEDKHLVTLAPGEGLAGPVVLQRGRTFAFDSGRYSLAAYYYCPFSGERNTPIGPVRIVNAPLHSNRVEIDPRR